jgi:hypothetical protein
MKVVCEECNDEHEAQKVAPRSGRIARQSEEQVQAQRA